MPDKFEPLHLISTDGGNPKTCPECGSTPDKWEVRDYDLATQTGDIYCGTCGKFVRMYDAG
jgi:hypothetical protein